MFPIRQTVAELDTKLGGSRAKDPSKAFWDIASQITSFRDGMHSVIDEFSKGISPSDEDFKYNTTFPDITSNYCKHSIIFYIYSCTVFHSNIS